MLPYHLDLDPDDEKKTRVGMASHLGAAHNLDRMFTSLFDAAFEELDRCGDEPRFFRPRAFYYSETDELGSICAPVPNNFEEIRQSAIGLYSVLSPLSEISVFTLYVDPLVVSEEETIAPAPTIVITGSGPQHKITRRYFRFWSGQPVDEYADIELDEDLDTQPSTLPKDQLIFSEIETSATTPLTVALDIYLMSFGSRENSALWSVKDMLEYLKHLGYDTNFDLDALKETMPYQFTSHPVMLRAD